MSPALTRDPTQPVVELWSRKSCKVARWLPVTLAAAFTCQIKGNQCLKSWSNGWAQINVSHAESICAAFQHSARCSLPPRGCNRKVTPWLLFSPHFWPKMSCTCAFVHVHSRKGACLCYYLRSVWILPLLLMVNNVFKKTQTEKPKWRLIYKNIGHEYKSSNCSGSASVG